MYWPLHEEPYDYYRFTKYGFETILRKNKFQIMEIIANGGKWALLGQVIIHSIHKTWLYNTFMIRFINKFFSWLDRHAFDPSNTMNYIVIARKQ